MEDVYEEVVRIKQGGDVAALATIVWVKGSTPRAEGSKMLVRSDGSILGSVGGGCLEAEVWEAVKTPAVYIGMIGSKKKVKMVFSNLKSEGIPQEVLGRVHAPTGLPIATETPEEIAVSIMAEIIDVRGWKTKKSERSTSGI